ncbi:MAG TPA: hypothetical protein VE974_01320 [Thermoanaerobaculia bacterium]|nr:hypothetical protein [Thermoanaerobaculia bacterium]
MNVSVWCELTNRVVVRCGTGDLDARQRRDYLTHVRSCLSCRSRLGASGRVLYASLDNEDPAVWPHLATATIEEIASLGDAAVSELLHALPAIGVHLEECSVCAARLNGHGAAAAGARSDTTSVVWDVPGEQGQLRWAAGSPLLPRSIWTVRLTVANGRLTGELEVAASEEIDWTTAVVTFASEYSAAPTLRFAPGVLRAEVALNGGSESLETAACAVILADGAWQAYVDGSAYRPTMRDASSARQAPCRLRIAAPHSPHDPLTAAVAVAGTLVEDTAGRLVRFVFSPQSTSGEIESLDGDRIGRWTAVRRAKGADVVIGSDLPHQLWLSPDLDDYDVEVLPTVMVVERDRSIRIAGRLAAASGQTRLIEKGRRFLVRGRHEVPLEDGTAIELQERDGRLFVRWLQGKSVRLKGRPTPLGQRFEEIVTPGEVDLQTLITSALEWVD